MPELCQFAAWRDLAAPYVDILPATASPPGFIADLEIWDLGSVAFMHGRSPAIAYARTAHHLRANPIDHWFLTFARSGNSTLRPGGRAWRSTSAARRLSVGSLRDTFQGSTANLDALILFLPRDFCRDAAATLDAVINTQLTSGLGQLLADYMLDLDRRLPMLTEAELPSLLAATRAMVLACITADPDRLMEAQRPIEATLLERAKQLIQENLLSPALGADELCRQLGVSRSRLYRLFEPLGGVVRYIRCRRLLDAHVALCDANDDRRIADIAAERGFVDAAEFSRAFKREFGYRPRDARNDAMPRPRAEMVPFATPRGGLFGSLMERLQSPEPTGAMARPEVSLTKIPLPNAATAPVAATHWVK
ncbi:helix-turn-helix domain-containing protein [Devosia limi]|uniref:helix-turn-helix domain-containing protein n=1 Tax=Devosia limi TaxID=288995 RepID=UPI00069BAFDD|nr:helix-turn-helix domain-containing protein [Devosia limi]